MNKNKGFTLFELVVTIAVLSVMSISLASIIVTNKDATENISEKMFAIGVCENSIVVFRAAASNSGNLEQLYQNFRTNAKEALNITLSDKMSDNKAIVYFDNEFCQIDNDNEKAQYTCTFEFVNTEKLSVILNVYVESDRKLMELEYSCMLKEKV